MIKKKFLSLLAAVAVACGLVGCQANTGAETYSQTVKSKTTSTKIVSETTTPESSEKTSFNTDFETSDWTFDDFVSDVEINGIKLSLPCSYDELSKYIELQKPKYTTGHYDEEIEKYCYSYVFRYKDDSNLIARVEYHSKSGEDNLSAEDMYSFFIASDLTGDNVCLFRFGEINNYSNMTKNDVEKILGTPSEDTPFCSWYRFNNSNDIVIHYDKNHCVDYINCFWNEKENNQ